MYAKRNSEFDEYTKILNAHRGRPSNLLGGSQRQLGPQHTSVIEPDTQISAETFFVTPRERGEGRVASGQENIGGSRPGSVQRCRPTTPGTFSCRTDFFYV